MLFEIFVGCMCFMDWGQLMLFSMYLLIVVLFLLRRRQCVICLARRYLLIPCLMGVSSRWVCHLMKFVLEMSVSLLVEICGVL